MYKIYSNIQKDVLLHMVFWATEFPKNKKKRSELVAPDEWIQVSALNMDKGQSFKPHQHIWKEVPGTAIAQESWVVIRGAVEVSFYDVDGTLIIKRNLYPGDISITLQGGHTYKILENNTFVYEFKTGPYTGQENDKIFI